MSRLIPADKRPCSTCPYRVDTPPGIWAPEEYERLTKWEENPLDQHIFLCHHSNGGQEKICKGWLTVERESTAARMAVLNGRISDEDRYLDPDVELYPTGRAAREAGLTGVERPSPAAMQRAERLVDQLGLPSPHGRTMKRIYYISFADPHKPQGDQFLGGCFVEVRDMDAFRAVNSIKTRRIEVGHWPSEITEEEAWAASAVERAHELGCNPGGEAILMLVPLEREEAVRASGKMATLLTREEIDAL